MCPDSERGFQFPTPYTSRDLFFQKHLCEEKSRNKSSPHHDLTRTCSSPLKETLSLGAVTPPLLLQLREPTGLFSVSVVCLLGRFMSVDSARGFVHQRDVFEVHPRHGVSFLAEGRPRVPPAFVDPPQLGLGVGFARWLSRGMR